MISISPLEMTVKSKMNSNKKLQLIEGEFSFNEAKEILTSMFNSKITCL